MPPATPKSIANMATFISYWDTPGSPAEEETQSAANPVLQDVGCAMLTGAEELDQLALVDPAGDPHDEEVVVVDVTKGGQVEAL